jgi:hypothetical protein
LSLFPASSIGRAGQRPHLSQAVIAALIAAVALLGIEAMRGFSGLTNSRGDNDSLLRMVEVRDLLAGQGWFDLTQYRLGLDGGTVMHWSRLVDAPIAAIVWVVERLGGSASVGETAALILWPLTCFTFALFFIVRAAARLGGEAAILPAAVIGAACLFSIGIFGVGAIDHHNVQFALTIATLSLLLDAEYLPRRALAAGVASGLSMAVGMETAPYVTAAACAVAVLYVVQGERAARMAGNYGIGFAATGLAVLVTTILPSQWRAPACDAFSVVQFAVMAVGGLGLVVVTALPSLRGNRLRRTIAVGLVALAVATVVIVFFPQCLAPPYSEVDPRQRIYWLNGIREAQSAWVTFLYDPAAAVGRLATPILALIVMTLAAWRAAPRFATILVGICLFMATMVSLYQIRGGAFAAGLAVVPLAAWVGAWRAQGDTSLAGQLKMLGVWLLSINLTWGGIAYAFTAIGGPTELAETVADNDGCVTDGDYVILKSLPPATVLSGINQGSPILNFTHHRVLAAPYHRDVGNVVAYETFSNDPDKARQVLLDADVGVVAICRLVDESPDLPPTSLHARLMRGEPPDWLHIVPASKGRSVEVYRVAPPAG